MKKSIAIIGTVGVPSNYGGFETLAENLVKYHHEKQLPAQLVVYCSAKSYADRQSRFLDAELRYVNLNANGISSIIYDVISLASAILRGADVILLLGVSGAGVLPLVRLFSNAHIVTNIDGIEWKRDKWNRLARWFLRISERIAVRYSHDVIADNRGIAEHVFASYGRSADVIAYGGDHAYSILPKPYMGHALPSTYALALCRIEPENNVALILETFSRKPQCPLVFIGNWNNSRYARELKEKYGSYPHLHLINPIYDLGILRTIRTNASLYIHGHSAGGTNPSLVEMMHFGIPVFAFDCNFNRFTTDNKAHYFADANALNKLIDSLSKDVAKQIGAEMRLLAQKIYTWDFIGSEYFQVLLPYTIENLQDLLQPKASRMAPNRNFNAVRDISNAETQDKQDAA